ncbi:uncharacterized protein LOC134826323 isoform X2 [Bolinopsis microptera]|uniref:uncharacterized protein LOC134826323 isoform X2 n=1 Tax=Bolinopsis microptera TaxID=2820187 RepID=UPI0030799FC7
MVCCSFRTLYLLYELGYYTVSVLLSVADPVLDLIVGFNYLSDDDTVFGIATLCLCFLPGLLMSALSFQWIVYDSTLESMIKSLMTQERYHAPRDYTHYFKKKGAPLPQHDVDTEHNTINLSDERYEDVEIHPPEKMEEIELDGEKKVAGEGTANENKTAENGAAATFDRNIPSRASRWRARAKREQSQISVDAGLSRYPLIITGPTIDGEIKGNVIILTEDEQRRIREVESVEGNDRNCFNKRKRVFFKTLEELKIEPVKPSLDKVRFIEIIFHVLGLPGITRYGALFLQALRNYRKREELTDKYDLFVKEATERGIKEVYFNKDLSEKYHGRRDAALLRLIEGSLESTPQLLLQLYIIVVYTQWTTSWFTYLSVAVSFTSVVWSMTSYIYEHRAASYDKASMDMYAYFITILIKLFMCISRITAILLAATYSGYLVLAVCIGHWLSCLLYVCYAKTHFYGGLIYNEWFFKLITSITLVLTFMNIVEGNSFVRWCGYHGFTLIQNLIMLLLWYFDHYSEPSKPDFYGIMLICMVVGGTIIGSILTLFYYQLCHPSKKHVLELSKVGPVLEELRKKHTSRTTTFQTSV